MANCPGMHRAFAGDRERLDRFHPGQPADRGGQEERKGAGLHEIVVIADQLHPDLHLALRPRNKARRQRESIGALRSGAQFPADPIEAGVGKPGPQLLQVGGIQVRLRG